AQAVEAAGGRPKRRRVARTQPQPEPQGDPEPVHVDEPQPDPAPSAEEDDRELLGEADFQEDDDTVQE
ncbi:hypothetical protein A2U01_0108241, partial [Trifolium medium]|nr:hypothetical protein [Trifolium medium]